MNEVREVEEEVIEVVKEDIETVEEEIEWAEKEVESVAGKITTFWHLRPKIPGLDLSFTNIFLAENPNPGLTSWHVFI